MTKEDSVERCPGYTVYIHCPDCNAVMECISTGSYTDYITFLQCPKCGKVMEMDDS